MSKPPEGPNIDSEAVLAFLRANPDFLVANGLGNQQPDPSSSIITNSDNIVDLTPAIARRARAEAAAMNETNRSILHLAAENMVSWQRLHHATLALLATTDIPSLCEVVEQDFPAIFDVLECRLITDQPNDIPHNDGFGKASKTQMIAALGTKALRLGLPDDTTDALFGKTVPSLAMIRLPDHLLPPVSRCVLMLAGKEKASFTPDLAGDLLILLAEMVGVTLAARLEMITPETPI